ncbi:hypothetical protein O6H91_11G018400 [Diphasiastrum complanatum]|nr:hypothetical protein O6H91_11G018400 [Diphasiastrum complanatum]
MAGKAHKHSPETRVLVAYAPSCSFVGASTGSTGNNGDGRFLHLRNPKSGTRSCYILMDESLQELQWFKQRYGSWFIGDSVCEDGSLYLASPIDPIFMALPILEEARLKKGDDKGKFRSLEDIMFLEGYPAYRQLMPTIRNSIDAVCEVKEIGTEKYYRLDDCKVLGWLCCKVKQTSDALKSSGTNLFSMYTEEDLNVYTIGLLGEYLKVDPWIERVCNYFRIDLEASKKVRPPAALTTLPSIPFKATLETKSSNLSKKVKRVPQPGASKITSFFARPR